MMNKYRLWLLTGGLVALSSGAQAQPTPVDTADAQAELESQDIIVTARRRDERLQETPVAVTALNSETLQERAVFNTQDLGRLAPSLNIRSGAGSQTQSFIFIRGIGQGNDNPSLEPGVGIYVDDVFLPRSQGGLLDLNDVAQVEVLRGPQGTLYGKNTIGGAIKYTSILPGQEPERRIVANYGRYDERRLSVAVNQPIVDDKLFVRVSGTYRARDGIYTNPFDGRKTADLDSLNGRAMLRFTPSPALDFLVSFDAYRDRSIDVPNRLLARNPTPALGAIEGGPAGVGSLAPFLLAPGGDPRFGGGSDVRADPILNFKPRVDLFGASFRASWTGENISLKSITAFRELDSIRVLDVDGTPRRVLNIGDETVQEQFSQEFQLSGNFGAVDFIGGLFYFNENLTNDFRQTITPLGVRTDRLNEIGTESYAAYLNLTWEITERLSATIGGRYTRETRKLASTLRRPPELTVLVPRFGDKKVYTDFSPKIEVDYKFGDAVFAYVTFSEGFKSGGFNNQAGNQAQLFAFLPEQVKSYEFGLKTQTPDRRLTVNLAAFYTDYKNLQANVFGALGNNGALVPVVTNAGSAEIYGIEVEANARPFQGLTLFGNFAWNDSKFKRFFDPALGDLSGNKPTNIPEYSYFIGADYRLPVGSSAKFFVSGDYYWKSKSFLDVVNTPILTVPSAETVNARAGVTFDNGLEIAIYGKNLTNTQILQSGSQALASLGIAWGGFSMPLTYGAELSWRF